METGWRRNYLRYKSFFLNMLTQYQERSDWKVYLEILLSLSTISIFSIFALRPTILTIAELIQQIEEKKETVEKMDTKIQNLGKAQSLYDREGPNIQLLTNTVIPEGPNSDVFARQVEGLSSRHQLPVSAITLGDAEIFNTNPKNSIKESEEVLSEMTKEETSQGSSQISFSISAGLDIKNYSSALNFLSDFENLRMPPALTNMQISVKDEGELNERSLNLLLEGELPY